MKQVGGAFHCIGHLIVYLDAWPSLSTLRAWRQKRRPEIGLAVHCSDGSGHGKLAPVPQPSHSLQNRRYDCSNWFGCGRKNTRETCTPFSPVPARAPHFFAAERRWLPGDDRLRSPGQRSLPRPIRPTVFSATPAPCWPLRRTLARPRFPADREPLLAW